MERILVLFVPCHTIPEPPAFLVRCVLLGILATKQGYLSAIPAQQARMEISSVKPVAPPARIALRDFIQHQEVCLAPHVQQAHTMHLSANLRARHAQREPAARSLDALQSHLA